MVKVLRSRKNPKKTITLLENGVVERVLCLKDDSFLHHYYKNFFGDGLVPGGGRGKDLLKVFSVEMNPPFLTVMHEYVPGEMLFSTGRTNDDEGKEYILPISFDDFLIIAKQVKDQISVLRKNGMIHADICENVVWDKETKTARLIDFDNMSYHKEADERFSKSPNTCPEKVSLETNDVITVTAFGSDLYKFGGLLSVLLSSIDADKIDPKYETVVEKIKRSIDQLFSIDVDIRNKGFIELDFL